MNKPKTPRYTIDDETRELLEAALNMVSQTASLQIDDAAAEGLVTLTDEIAHRFYIDAEYIEVIDELAGDTYDDPSTITVYRTREDSSTRKKKPTLTLVTDNTEGVLNDEPPTEDEKMH